MILPKRRIFKRYDSANVRCATYLFFLHAATAPTGPRGPAVDAARAHSDDSQSVGFLWMSDQPDAENST
jgi:hypothetical protein